jgi:hypothetical protein
MSYTTQGPPATVSVQQMSDLVAAISNSVRALGVIAQALGNAIGPHALSTPVQLAGYTAANLPAITLSSVGSLAFCTNALANTVETTGNGTGTTVQVQNKAGTATWCAVWSGVLVTT